MLDLLQNLFQLSELQPVLSYLKKFCITQQSASFDDNNAFHLSPEVFLPPPAACISVSGPDFWGWVSSLRPAVRPVFTYPPILTRSPRPN